MLLASHSNSQYGQYFYLTLLYNRIRKFISTEKSPDFAQLLRIKTINLLKSISVYYCSYQRKRVRLVQTQIFCEHRACIGSFYTQLRFFYYGKKIRYNKQILQHLFSSNVRTVNIVLVLVSLYFYVNLHFAKFKFAKLIADGIESNPRLDHSKHFNRSVLHDTYQRGVKFSEKTGFQCIYNSILQYAFH